MATHSRSNSNQGGAWFHRTELYALFVPMILVDVPWQYSCICKSIVKLIFGRKNWGVKAISRLAKAGVDRKDLCMFVHDPGG